MQHHGWRLEELDNMIPWERETYLILLSNHLKEELERRKRNGT